MQKKVWIIFNIGAGQAQREQHLALLHQCLAPHFMLYFHLTTPETSATQLAHQALAAGADLVVACGGDGTVAGVVQALAGTAIPLGIVPLGTSNAVANALGLPQTIEAACNTILAGHTCCIDTALCNGHRFVQVAGVGFGAATIAKTPSEAKESLGPLAYVLSGINQLADLTPFMAHLTTPQGTYSGLVTAVSVANLAPPTTVLAQGPAQINPRDGLLDVTLVASVGPLEALTVGYHLWWSALQQLPADQENIAHFQTPYLQLTTEPALDILMDGEILGTTPLEIQCVPQSLYILSPAC